MLAKGCSFDAIAELSGMSISTMQPFYHYFWNKFTEVHREIWIKYPKTPEEAADNLAVYRRCDSTGSRVPILPGTDSTGSYRVLLLYTTVRLSYRRSHLQRPRRS